MCAAYLKHAAGELHGGSRARRAAYACKMQSGEQQVHPLPATFAWVQGWNRMHSHHKQSRLLALQLPTIPASCWTGDNGCHLAYVTMSAGILTARILGCIALDRLMRAAGKVGSGCLLETGQVPGGFSHR